MGPPAQGATPESYSNSQPRARTITRVDAVLSRGNSFRGSAEKSMDSRARRNFHDSGNGCRPSMCFPSPLTPKIVRLQVNRYRLRQRALRLPVPASSLVLRHSRRRRFLCETGHCRVASRRLVTFVAIYGSCPASRSSELSKGPMRRKVISSSPGATLAHRVRTKGAGFTDPEPTHVLVKDMKSAREQGWGQITTVLPPLPGMPF